MLASNRNKGKISLDLEVEVDQETCEMIRQSLSPDNNADITMECRDGKLSVKVRNLKIASLYNITDDILRCYETSKKIVDGKI